MIRKGIVNRLCRFAAVSLYWAVERAGEEEADTGAARGTRVARQGANAAGHGGVEGAAENPSR